MNYTRSSMSGNFEYMGSSTRKSNNQNCVWEIEKKKKNIKTKMKIRINFFVLGTRFFSAVP